MQDLVEIYEGVLAALDPRRMAREALRDPPRPAPGGRLVALGLGKVATELLEGAREALGPVAAVLAVAQDSPHLPNTTVLRGGHPLPDAGSLRAGEVLLAVASSLRPTDAALVLVSGGGSALAEAPREPLELEELRAINEALIRSGAPIEQMNCVRAHISRLKGGGLARALHAAGVRRALALVAVDVPVGGVGAVSSGPAHADPTTIEDARRLARDLRLPGPAAAAMAETLKPGEPADFVPHVALNDLTTPAREAARLAGASLFEDLPVRGTLEEFARVVASRRGLWAGSGELEAKVPPDAPPGGRDQHLALLVARELRGSRDARFLAAGTDGHDVATDAAGAIVDGTTWDEAERRGLAPSQALARHDATRVLREVGALLPARHTGAHAGDLFLLRR